MTIYQEPHVNKLYLILLLVLLILTTFPVIAQSPEDSHIILYAESLDSDVYQAELILLDANSLVVSDIVNLPVELGLANATYASDVRVDNEYHYVALHHRAEGGNESLRLYNRDTKTCCVDLGALVNGKVFDVGGFDPEGRSFAFSYAGVTGDYSPLDGGIAIYDLEQDMITYNLTMADVLAKIEETYAVWANMGQWIDRGILFAPNCYGCEGVSQGEYTIYNPDTDMFIEKSGILFQDGAGARLDATGEFLSLEFDINYSHDPTYILYHLPNVITHRLTESSDRPISESVIFASDHMIVLDHVVWINDGRAILVESRIENFWLIRDRVTSELQTVNHGSQETVLGGLANGWLSQVPQSDGLTAIKFWDGTSLTSRTLSTYQSSYDIQLVQSPPMGEDLTISTFPKIVSPENIIVQCSGFLPSRLTVGETARVTLGESNNLRDEPGTYAQSIGRIPGGESFIVLEGPFCDVEGNKYSWWRIDYNGLIGWTVEGSGNTYWLEPIP